MRSMTSHRTIEVPKSERVVSPVGRFTGSFRPRSGSIRPETKESFNSPAIRFAHGSPRSIYIFILSRSFSDHHLRFLPTRGSLKKASLSAD